MRPRGVRSTARFALLAWLGTGALTAQNVTGSIAGVCSDPSGAVIPGITVVAVNEGTGERFESSTDSAGQYVIRALPIGFYRLSAEAQGFKRFETRGIRVQVNEVARVDITLELGSPVETVTVTSQVVTVDTTTGILKTVVDQKRIEELPLNGRNPLQLVRLVAGTTTDWRTDTTSGTTYPGSARRSVGQRQSRQRQQLHPGRGAE